MKKLILTTIAAVTLSFNVSAEVTVDECVALGDLASTAVELRQEGKSKALMIEAIRATSAEDEFKTIGYNAVDLAFNFPILDSKSEREKLAQDAMVNVIVACMRAR